MSVQVNKVRFNNVVLRYSLPIDVTVYVVVPDTIVIAHKQLIRFLYLLLTTRFGKVPDLIVKFLITRDRRVS